MPSFVTFTDLLKDELFSEQNPRNTLFHYTSIETFKNVIYSESLWMTDVRYANDAKEYLHGIELINSVLTEYITYEKYNRWLPNDFSAENREVLKEQLSVIARELQCHNQDINENTMEDAIFVFCLSSEPDLLTQWTSYAGEGGVAIGFDTETLRYSTQFKYGWSEGISLLKCLYERADQIKIVEKILDMHLRDDVCDLKQDTDQISKEGLIANFRDRNAWIFDNFQKLAPLLKDNYFRQEQEYRVIASISRSYEEHPERYPIDIRGSKTMLIPYYNFTFKKDSRPGVHWKYLPNNGKDGKPIDFKKLITSIKLGPGRDQAKALHSLKLFVRKYIGTHCAVSTSDAPYIYR